MTHIERFGVAVSLLSLFVIGCILTQGFLFVAACGVAIIFLLGYFLWMVTGVYLD